MKRLCLEVPALRSPPRFRADINILNNIRPCEIYRLGAQNHVQVSFDTPEYTGNVTALEMIRILEAACRTATTGWKSIMQGTFSLTRHFPKK